MLKTYFLRAPLLTLLLAAAPAAFAQTGGVGIGTTAPNASAALDIVSTSKGALLPRMTAAQLAAIASPAPGLLVFQTDGTTGFYYNAGTAAAPSWQQVATAAGTATTAGNGLTKTGSSIGLGGSLGAATTIAQAGFPFSLTGGSVGIGTSSPATPLDVRTTDASAAITVGKTDATAGALYFGNSNHGLKRNYGNSANNVGLYTTAGSLYLSATGIDDITQFTLLTGGNVGIGTSTPGQKLDVNGGLNVSGTSTVSGTVGIGTTAPVASAQLEMASTTKGFLPPRMSQAQRDAIGSPAAGLTIFNTDSDRLNLWDGTTWAALIAGTAIAPAAALTYTYTAGVQAYTVPAGMTLLTVTAMGAAGGYSSSNGYAGGQGGSVTATIPVTPGETLNIYVGGKGGDSFSGSVGAAAGYNGGGQGFARFSTGGGGGTDIRRGTSLTDRLVVGGGGGGPGPNSRAGAGGNPGVAGNSYSSGGGGAGGTQSGGGTGGPGNWTGGPGSLGQGGNSGVTGPSSTDNGTGAGGGGYYGGGGGGLGQSGTTNGGGGGGSSWATPTATNVSYQTGGNTGNGSLTLVASAQPAPAFDGSNIVNLPDGPWSVSGSNLYRASGNVGVGTSAPGHPLVVQAPGGDTKLLGFNNNAGTDRYNFSLANGGLNLSESNVAGGRIFVQDGTGNVGLGTTSPGQKLDVAGNVNIASNGGNQLFITSTAADPNGLINLTIPATSVCPTCSELILFRKADGTALGNITANLSSNSVVYNTTSDKRLKEHIGRTHFGLQDLLKLEVKDYNFIGQPVANRTTGFLAQDLFTVYPDAVKEGDHNATVSNAWGVDYGRLTPLLVQAIQDQQRLIDQQQAEIQALKAQAATAETKAAQATATTEAFEARLRALEAGGGQARK